MFLQPQNIDTLCKAIVDTAELVDSTLTTTAEEISRKYTRVFTLFAACHAEYNSCKQFSAVEITALG
jgi:hypothetical protein